MKRLKRHWKVHYCDFRKSFFIFWLVILAVFTLNIILSTIFDEAVIIIGFSVSDEVYTANSFVGAILFAVFIYLLVYSFEALTERYGFVVSLGATRKDYYNGLASFYLFLAAAMSVLLTAIYFIERIVYAQQERIQLNLIHHFFQVEDTFFHHLVFYFTLLLVFIALLNLITFLYYRIGKTIWLLVLFIFFALILFSPFRNLAWESARFFFAENNFTLFNLKLLFLSLLLFLCGWPVIRKAEVKAPSGS